MFVPIIQFNSMKNKLKVNTKFCNNVSNNNNNNNSYLNRDVSRVLCKYRVWVGFTRQKCNRLCVCVKASFRSPEISGKTRGGDASVWILGCTVQSSIK